MEDIERDKKDLEHAVEVNEITAKLLQSVVDQNKGLWIALVCAFVAVLALCGCMAYQTSTMQETVAAAISESQTVFNEALLEALNTVAEMEVTSDTTTTTTTLEGDYAAYIAGNQFNDNAVQTGGVK